MATTGISPAYTRFHWGKAEPRDGHPKRIHLLEHHLADVGACFEALVSQPTIRQRLANSGGLEVLDDTTAARLSLFAALHDIGKVNIGFQTRIWESSYLQDLPGVPRTGHTLDLTPVLNDDDLETARWFFDALGWWWDAVESWDDCEGETVCGLFVAALSHHGLPLQLRGKRFANPSAWRSFGELDPEECVRRIGRLAREWFPAAWEPGGPPLPPAPEFQHMFLGLCTLADWVGSSESNFPFRGEPDDDYMALARRNARSALSAIGLDLSKQRAALSGQLPSFERVFAFDPNAIQRAEADTPAGDRLVIIESETGSGKTEAALWRFARMYDTGLVDGLYFALPSRAAATQLHGRLTAFVNRLFPAGHVPEPVLAVPGYLKAGDAAGRRLQDYKVWWDDHPDDVTRAHRWAAEGTKRYLAAQIAVGTVDQAMMAALKVKHAHMRAGCLARNLLVVDEVHASDPYMGLILRSLLEGHVGSGGYALLMSATLGSVARRQWLSVGSAGLADVPSLDEAIATPYPAIGTTSPAGEVMTAVGRNDEGKTVHVDVRPLMNSVVEVAELALQAARDGAAVLVIRNTVDYAIETQMAIEKAAAGQDRSLLFACNDTPTLHHGRFSSDDRRLLDGVVESRLGKCRSAGVGAIVVGTQTLEQSLDIDADLLITDLCPMDVLLQRTGRLHRHRRDSRPAGYTMPRCIVLVPSGDDLSPLLKRGSRRNGLGPYGYVYPDLRILEATRRLVLELPRWSIPEMNRELVERATHPDALDAIVRELGEQWLAHTQAIRGGEIAEGLTARSAIIRRDRSFYIDNREVLFGSVEESIRTRLGDEGIDVEFDPAPVGPFDKTRRVDSLSVPARWLSGRIVDDSLSPQPYEGGFAFHVGDREFLYDRLGLRRKT